MGSCASSKYAKDEDHEKSKAPKKTKSKSSTANSSPTSKLIDQQQVPSKEHPSIKIDDTPNEPKSLDEGIEFIDKDESQTNSQSCNDEDKAKKEVTSYQTTVVKNVEKEGAELLDHLRHESFIVFQNLFKEKSHQTINENIKSHVNGVNETTYSSVQSTNDELLAQIKAQALSLFGQSKAQLVDNLIHTSINALKTSGITSMNDLEEKLKETHEGNDELITKFINLVTGFLTAKGTDAGIMLSTILANTGNGLQGVLKEVEKTTVKVTRTIKETMLNAAGEVLEVRKTVKIDENPPSDILDEIERKQQKHLEETHEQAAQQNNLDAHEDETRKQAEMVVNHVMNVALERLAQEQTPEEVNDKYQVEQDFFKNGKLIAEDSVKSTSCLDSDNNRAQNSSSTQ